MKIIVSSLTFLSLAVANIGFSATAFRCGGTEPFWSLEVQADGSMVFSDPVAERIDIGANVPRSAYGRMPEYMAAYDSQETTGAKRAIRAYIFANDKCSDGMSDETYTHQIIFDNGKVWDGCCRVK